MTSDIIPIILSCDNRFVRHAAVTIISIVKNSARRYRFYLLDCGISEANVQKLKAWDLGDNEIVVVKMEKNAVFESIPLQPWFSPAIFYRIMIPELFPELDKAIYLDCDIVVVGDLGELWDVDLGDKLLGVVYMEPEFVPVGFYDTQKKALSIPLNKRYFNNGVLVMNVQALREWKFLDRMLQFLQAHRLRLRYPEQDAMNCLLHEAQLCELNPRFNVMIPCPYTRTVIKRDAAIVIHYIRTKPWWFFEQWVQWCPGFYFHMLRPYFVYAKLTPWQNVSSNDVHWGRFAKELLKVGARPFKYAWQHLTKHP